MIINFIDYSRPHSTDSYYSEWKHLILQCGCKATAVKPYLISATAVILSRSKVMHRNSFLFVYKVIFRHHSDIMKKTLFARGLKSGVL